jgi:hypothetical protein
MNAVHLIESGEGLKPLINPGGTTDDEEALSYHAAPRRGGIRLDRRKGKPALPKKMKDKDKNQQQSSTQSAVTSGPSPGKSFDKQPNKMNNGDNPVTDVAIATNNRL